MELREEMILDQIGELGLEAKPILQLKFSPKHQTNSQRLYFHLPYGYPSTKES